MANDMIVKKTIIRSCLFVWFIGALPLAADAQDRQQIFAAASLRGGLEAALEGWPGDARTSYGGSGAIARQVSLGADADLVIFANPAWDIWLEKQSGKAVASVSLLSNRLVLIGPNDAAAFTVKPDAASLKDRLNGARLAMGQRDAVPAGQYGRAWLESIGAWEDIAPHLAEAENVRAALAYVARQETPLGIVYATDALAEPRVHVLWEIAPDAHPDIIYPARALTPEGAALLNYLQTPEAQARFLALGYLPAKAPAP